jgi:hypothetical protein
MASALDGAPAPLTKSHAKLGAIGRLTLPDGRLLDYVSGSDLARALIAMGVAGVTHANGREANAKLYADHLEELARAAGKKAVEVFQRETFRSGTFQTGKNR